MHCAIVNNDLFMILRVHSYKKKIYTATFNSENIARLTIVYNKLRNIKEIMPQKTLTSPVA